MITAVCVRKQPIIYTLTTDNMRQGSSEYRSFSVCTEFSTFLTWATVLIVFAQLEKSSGEAESAAVSQQCQLEAAGVCVCVCVCVFNYDVRKHTNE